MGGSVDGDSGDRTEGWGGAENRADDRPNENQEEEGQSCDDVAKTWTTSLSHRFRTTTRAGTTAPATTMAPALGSGGRFSTACSSGKITAAPRRRLRHTIPISPMTTSTACYSHSASVQCVPRRGGVGPPGGLINDRIRIILMARRCMYVDTGGRGYFLLLAGSKFIGIDK